MAAAARGSAKKGGRKLGQKATRPASEHQRAVNRENASKPRGAVPAEIREKLTEAKGALGRALVEHGVPHIVRILEDGPAHEHFQWAADFAADRGGLPRRREEQIDAADLPPMVIEFKNYPRPNAGSD